MPYQIIFQRPTEGVVGQYARIRRVADGRYWNNVSSTWNDSPTTQMNIALTESAVPGQYVGSAGFTPPQSALYEITAYEQNGSVLGRTIISAPPTTMTALEMVQEIQREMRLPLAVDFAQAHSQLILSYINNVLVNIVSQDVVWDELRVAGDLPLRAGVAQYAIAPINVRHVELIRDMRLSGERASLEQLSDEQFREYRAAATTPGQPRVYRRASRAGGVLFVELSPVPDQSYTLEYEILQRPPRLVNTTDVPLMDPETIILGAKALAKYGHGVGFDLDVPIFQSKKGLQEGAQGDSNWGNEVTPI